MTKDNFPKVDFEFPPLIEVVCGIQFGALEKFHTAHTGKLWREFEPDFSQVKDVQALLTLLEPLPGIEQPQLQIKPTLMPRTVFSRVDNSAVIQVQKDGFYKNWQKGHAEQDYPRYEAVIESFGKDLGIFERFVKEQTLGEINPIQFELTYLNEIPIDLDCQILKDAHWTSDHKRLPDPELISLTSQFLIPGSVGRLTTQFKNVINQRGDHVYHWNLTVRGCTNPRSDMSLSSMRPWFDNARLWINNAFVDLSDEDCQRRIWGLRE